METDVNRKEALDVNAAAAAAEEYSAEAEAKKEKSRFEAVRQKLRANARQRAESLAMSRVPRSSRGGNKAG
jgi:DNA-binding TFAR19-related protein (PDSD5 family)